MDRLPTATLSPLASRVDDVLALYDYEIQSAIGAIDAAVAGYGGLFDPGTTDDEIRTAIGEVLTTDPSTVTEGPLNDVSSDIVLYVDGSSRGNPGPAGAGAVLQTDATTIAFSDGRSAQTPKTTPQSMLRCILGSKCWSPAASRRL